jgi:hypothetical protein
LAEALLVLSSESKTLPTGGTSEVKNVKAANKRRCAAKRSVEHALLSVPTFGGILKGSVNTKDLAVGVGAGLLGQGGVKYVLEKVGMLATLPPLVQRFMPFLSGVVTGVGLLYLDKKVLKKGRGRAHMIGSIAAGAVVQGWQELQAQFPDKFNDYVYLPTGMAGILVDRPFNGMGMLIDTPNSSANLSALHAMNMANAAHDDDAI